MTSKNISRTGIFVAAVLCTLMAAQSAAAQEVIRKDSISAARRHIVESEMVAVKGDTVSIILPERNFGRYDRGLYNFLFIPKGTWAFGITASYGELSTDDTSVLSIIKDFDFSGKIYSIKPSVSYFFGHNQCIGLKLNYTNGRADLDGLSVDASDDINFSLHDVSYHSNTYSAGIFYRNYVGLGRDKRFSIFNEVDLMGQGGSSRFKRNYNNEVRDTRTTVTQFSLDFSPGMAVFIQQNLAFNVSFGVFGIKFRKEHQRTNGTDEGKRFTSGANFRFNIFNINFGLQVVI